MEYHRRTEEGMTDDEIIGAQYSPWSLCLYWMVDPGGFQSSAFLGERAVTRQWRSDYGPNVNNFCEGFPDDGPVVKNLPCNARNTGSVPGVGRFHMLRSNLTHVPQLLNLYAANTKAQMHLSLCSAAREGTTVGSPGTTMKSSPCSWQLERAWVQQRRPNTTLKKKPLGHSSYQPSPNFWPLCLQALSVLAPHSLNILGDYPWVSERGPSRPLLAWHTQTHSRRVGGCLGNRHFLWSRGEERWGPGSLTTNQTLHKCRY